MRKIMILILAISMVGCTPKLKTISFVESNISVDIGETKKVEYSTNLNDITRIELVWNSSDSNVVSVDQEGNLTGVSEGTATVTLTGESSISATIQVNVVYVNASAITIIGDMLVDLKSKPKLTVQFSPENVTDKTITWTSSNANIVNVDDSGVLSPLKVGTATITAETKNGIKGTYLITVHIPITSIKMNKTSLDLHAGETTTLVVTYTPSNATNKHVVWTSSNSSVATVDNTGKVKGIATGTAIITATTGNGIVATTNVSVKEKAPATILFYNYEIDYVGGVTFNFRLRNNSSKVVNYITVKWYCFNAVNDFVYDEINGHNYVKLRYTGPLKAGATTNMRSNATAFYNRNTRNVHLTEMIIEYADGTTITIDDSNSDNSYNWVIFN